MQTIINNDVTHLLPVLMSYCYYVAILLLTRQPSRSVSLIVPVIFILVSAGVSEFRSVKYMCIYRLK